MTDNDWHRPQGCESNTCIEIRHAHGCDSGNCIIPRHDGDLTYLRSTTFPDQPDFKVTADEWAQVALPDGGEWRDVSGWLTGAGFIEAASGGLVREPTHVRRVWYGPAEPIGDAS